MGQDSDTSANEDAHRGHVMLQSLWMAMGVGRRNGAGHVCLDTTQAQSACAKLLKVVPM